jgi:outer membrane lipoprotein-sorting protein
MRTLRCSLAAFALLMPVLCAAAEPTTLEEVSADMAAKSKQLDTYTADFDAVMNMGSMLMNFGGTMQGKAKMMRMTTNIDMMQQKISMTMILDAANIMWMDMDMMGMKQVMKMDMAKMTAMQEEMMGMVPGGMGMMGGPGSMQGDPREMLETMKKTMDVTYRGKEKFGDEDVYVFDATMKPELLEKMNESMSDTDAAAMGMNFAEMMGGTHMKFGVADGFPRSMEMMDKAGTAWMTQTYKNLKFNEPMDDALFTYTPAEGVMVIDMTEMMDAMTDEDAAPDPEEPADADQP